MEEQQATPSVAPQKEKWWKPLIAVIGPLLLLRLIIGDFAPLGELPVPTIPVALHPGAFLVAFTIVFLPILWLAALISLPLCVAWLSDTKAKGSPLQWSARRRINLNSARQAMTKIQEDLDTPQTRLLAHHDAADKVLDEVIQFILRDFVEAWHTPLLAGDPAAKPGDNPASSSCFPRMVDCTIRASLSSFSERMAAIDIANLVVCRVLPVFTEHMKAFEEAEVKWRRSGSAADIVEGEDGDVFLARLYNGGILHPAIGNIAGPDTKLTELEHLRKLSEKALLFLLPEREKRSRGVVILVREIVACAILKPTLDALSDPDTLNALLEEKAERALKEQKLVSQLREALDKEGAKAGLSKIASGSSDYSGDKNVKKGRFAKSLDDRKQSLDSFLYNINHSKSLIETRMARNGLLQQIRKTKKELERVDVQEEEARKQSLSKNLHQLQTAVDLAERRLHQLDSSTSTAVHKGAPTVGSITPSMSTSLTLKDVLTSSSAISSFLEFAEGRQRAILVQFWLSVNSFKNPLEAADSDSGEEETVPGLPSHSFSSLSMQMIDEKEVKVLCEDLSFFVDSYFQSAELAQVVKKQYIADAKSFVDSYRSGKGSVTKQGASLARRGIFKAQKQVYEEMLEEDWPNFQRMPAYHQALEDLLRERTQQTPSLSYSSSMFLDPSEYSPDTAAASRQQPSRAASHTHLFGEDEDTVRADDDTSLFGQGTSIQEGSRRDGAKSSIDQLMGGKGGTFEGVSKRTPLFREALFDDDDGKDEDAEEEEGVAQKEATIQVEKMEAIESVLASIIKEDLPPDQIKSKRPTLSRRGTSKQGQASGSHTPVLDVDGSIDTHRVYADSRPPSPGFSELARTSSLTSRSVNLGAELSRIEQGIRRLRDQEELLAALMRKAELTGSSMKETRLLQRSKETIARELRELKFEKANLRRQQEQQEQLQQEGINGKAAELVPGQMRIKIQHADVTHDTDGKEFARYLIEVSHISKPSDNSVGTEEVVAHSGWIVSRRYNEFFLLHSRLKDKYAQVRALDNVFPGKRFAGLITTAFLESRRVNLQKYLQEVTRWDVVCSSLELRMFLSQSVPFFSQEMLDPGQTTDQGRNRFLTNNRSSSSFVSRIYRGVTGVAEGLDELLFGPSMYEVVVNRLSISVVDLVGFSEMEKVLAGATVSSPAEIKEAIQATDTSFAIPICDAIIELFQLKLEGNWLRRQAVIIVAQQALGGTIERRVRQTISSVLEPSALQRHLILARETLWPNGKLKSSEGKRSIQERRVRKENALRKLSTFIPSIASHFVGRDNARRAARRSWAILQNKRLNKHILYTILDQVLDDVLAVK